MKNSKKFAAFILCLIIALSGVMPAFAASGKWIKSGSRWWYRHADSSYTSDGWEKINGKWYHFDSKGWMQSSRWLKDNGKWYYLWRDGHMLADSLIEGGYLDRNGVWHEASFDFNKTVVKIDIADIGDYATDTHRYTTNPAFISAFMDYMKSLPVSEDEEHPPVMGGAYMLTIYYSDGTVTPAGISVHSDADLKCNGIYYEASYHDIADFYQAMADIAAGAKWIKSGSRWWYRHADSTYTANGWEKIYGKWYHFDKNGWMQSNRWLKDSGKWYYLGATGAMQTGWKRIDRFWYFFNADGSMRTGWLKYRNNWYYLYVDGTMITDCIEAGGYLDNDGIWREMGPFNFDKTVMKIGMVKGGDYMPEDVRFTTNQAFISAFMDYLKALPVSENEEHKPTMGGGYTLTIYYNDGTVTPAYVNGANAPYLKCNDVYYDVSYQDINDFYQKLADLSAGGKWI